jgi:hypothetical protein
MATLNIRSRTKVLGSEDLPNGRVEKVPLITSARRQVAEHNSPPPDADLTPGFFRQGVRLSYRLPNGLAEPVAKRAGLDVARSDPKDFNRRRSPLSEWVTILTPGERQHSSSRVTGKASSTKNRGPINTWLPMVRFEQHPFLAF